MSILRQPDDIAVMRRLDTRFLRPELDEETKTEASE